MRLISDTLSETTLGSGIYHLTPADISIATAYKFEIDVFFND